MEEIKIGKKEVKINPQEKCLLSGHMARDKEYETILDDLYAKILIIEIKNKKIVFISLDVLELDYIWIDILKNKIENKIKIDKKNIIIFSSHTHTAPATITLGALEKNMDFLKIIEDSILSVIANIKINKKVDIFYGKTSCDIGVNRRFIDKKNKKISMKPNYKGSIDSEIPYLVFKNEKGKIEAIIFNVSVHPTTLGVNIYKVSADYPGRITSALKALINKDLLAMAMTGSCGDVRPNIVDDKGENFISGTEKDIENIGNRVATTLVESFESMILLKNVEALTIVHKKEIFNLEGVLTKEQMLIQQKNFKQEEALLINKVSKLTPFEKAHDNPLTAFYQKKIWLNRLLEKEEIEEFVEIEFSIVNIDNRFKIYCVPGELFSQIGLKIKANSNCPSIVCSYCNGSFGYLPSKEVIKEGGYETEDAYKFYGLAGKFNDTLEDKILNIFKEN